MCSLHMEMVQGRDVSSVRQYMESITVNLMLREPVKLVQQHVLPALRTYHAKSVLLPLPPLLS